MFRCFVVFCTILIVVAASNSWAQDAATVSPDLSVQPGPQINQGQPAEMPSSPQGVPVGVDVASLTPPAVSEQVNTLPPIDQALLDQIALNNPTIDVNLMRSLFFTKWEHDLIIDARRGLNTLPLDDLGLDEEKDDAPREIALGGIVFVSKKDWTVWLNGMRITPNAIPAEVMDMKVFKNHVDIEWFDSSTNQIFPIRLRPHQRFNLDSRMFLPG